MIPSDNMTYFIAPSSTKLIKPGLWLFRTAKCFNPGQPGFYYPNKVIIIGIIIIMILSCLDNGNLVAQD